MNKKESFKSGFVAITGGPNVGKSTLLNQILGEKVAIATPKPQTTRRNIKGILTTPDYQIVFIDTPGIHASERLLNKLIIKSAMDAIKDADSILLVIDASNWRKEGAPLLLDAIKKTPRPVILALNKIDMVAKESLLPIIAFFRDSYPFKAIVPISARYNDGISELISEVTALLPEGPQYYESSYITDQNMEEFASELVREKIFLTMREEVPYSIAVETEEFKYEERSGLIKIRVTIYVEKASQKGIIIGKGGGSLKKIGTLARVEMEKRLGAKVYLDLWVKVFKDWSKDERFLKRLGLGM
ncbi:MAG: GTPase Era [Dissulfurimicrobium sp.]|uniref:GTPase Era n=1 Tax=Dissulfurimicrobium sp. TaxID=2022436 RepID=UPI004048EBE4